MTKNFFRLLIILMLCFNYSLSKSNINVPGAKNIDWEVVKFENGMIKATTHGCGLWAHEFAVAKKKENCSQTLHAVIFYTDKKVDQSIINKYMNFQITIDNKTFFRKIQIRIIEPVSLLRTQVIFLNEQIDDWLFEALKNGKNVKVEMIGPQEYLKFFVLQEEKFSLAGFNDSVIKANKICREK